MKLEIERRDAITKRGSSETKKSGNDFEPDFGNPDDNNKSVSSISSAGKRIDTIMNVDIYHKEIEVSPLRKNQDMKEGRTEIDPFKIIAM